MTQRLIAWAESWPVFLAMCAWLLIWAGGQLADGGRSDEPQRGGSSAAQAADGAVTHRID